MKLIDYCRGNAIEAVRRASDPALPFEARVEWARISKVWQDMTQHGDLAGVLGAGRSAAQTSCDRQH